MNQTKTYSVYTSDYDSYDEVARYLDRDKAYEVAEVLGYDVAEESLEYEHFSKPGYEYVKEHGLKEYTIDMHFREGEELPFYVRREPSRSLMRIYNFIVVREYGDERGEPWVDYMGTVWATSEEAAVEYILSKLEGAGLDEETGEFVFDEELFVDEEYYASLNR